MAPQGHEWWNFFELQNQETGNLETCFKALMIMAYQFPSNDEPKFTIELSLKRSNWLPYTFIWEKYWKVIFLKTIECWLIIFSTNTLLIKNIEIYQLQGQCMTFDLCFKAIWIYVSDDFSSEPPGPISAKFLQNICRCMRHVFTQMVVVCWPKWLPCLCMLKTV